MYTLYCIDVYYALHRCLLYTVLFWTCLEEKIGFLATILGFLASILGFLFKILGILPSMQPWGKSFGIFARIFTPDFFLQTCKFFMKSYHSRHLKTKLSLASFTWSTTKASCRIIYLTTKNPMFP